MTKAEYSLILTGVPVRFNSMESVVKKPRAGQFQSQGKNIGTGVVPVSAKFPKEVDRLLRSLPNRSEFIREAVMEKLKAEGFI